MKPAWRVQLSQGAERDFYSILRWTTEHFGKQQARVYETTLRSALKALAAEPDAVGSHARPDLGPELGSLHVARQGRHGRHWVIFCANHEARTIVVLRTLHDSMDLARHLDS